MTPANGAASACTRGPRSRSTSARRRCSTTIDSPGLWCIESDSDPDYLDEVFAGEAGTLRRILAKLNVTVVEA